MKNVFLQGKCLRRHKCLFLYLCFKFACLSKIIISCGHHNVDIAEILSISANTAKDHTKNIYRKLGVHSRHAAAQMVNQQREHLSSDSDT